MKSKLLKILVLVMVFVLALSACQPAMEETEVMTEETEEVVVEETEAVVEEMTEEVVEETEVVVEPSATIRIWADEQRAPVLDALAEEFLAEYNVALVVENISGIRDQFSVAAPAGEVHNQGDKRTACKRCSHTPLGADRKAALETQAGYK